MRVFEILKLFWKKERAAGGFSEHNWGKNRSRARITSSRASFEPSFRPKIASEDKSKTYKFVKQVSKFAEAPKSKFKFEAQYFFFSKNYCSFVIIWLFQPRRSLFHSENLSRNKYFQRANFHNWKLKFIGLFWEIWNFSNSLPWFQSFWFRKWVRFEN